MLSTCTNAVGPGGRARLRISPPIWPATTPSWSARWTSSSAATGGAKVLLYGHSAGGLIVSLWLDRLRRRGADRRQARQRPCAQQPVAGPAGTGDPAHRRHRRDRRGVAVPQEAGGPLSDRGRLRHLTAPRLSRRVRLRPGLETGRRIPGDVRLDQRDQARPRSTASRPRRRGAQPDPAFGPQRPRGSRPRADPARRRRPRCQADRAVGGLHRQSDDDRAHRRRQTRRLPVVGRAAGDRVPRVGELAGLVCSNGRNRPTPQHNPNKG